MRYAGSDVILSGNATATTPSTWCTAGNALGAFRAGPLSSQPVLKTPAPLAGNFQEYTNLLGSGITFWAVNPNALNNPMAFWKSLYPNTTTQASPGDSWAVWQKELSSYLQADFSGELGSMRYSGNVGARLIHTNLNVTQYLTGLPGQYGTEPADAGTQVTQRSYNDVLPAANFALNVTSQVHRAPLRLQEHDASRPEPVGRRLGAELLAAGNQGRARSTRSRPAPPRAIRT